MRSLDNARLILSRALGLMRADGQTAEAETYFDAAGKLLKEAIAEDPMNAQVHFTYAQFWEARQRYDEAGVRYRDALGLAPTDETIQAAYEAMQVKRERDELVKRPGAVEVEAPPLGPIVEEEERVAKAAPEVEEAPLIEEGPVKIEEPYQDASGLAPTDEPIQAAYEAVQVERERDELAKMFEAVEVEASLTPPAIEPVVEEERRVAEIAPEVEEAPLVEEGPVEIDEPYWDAPGLAPTDEPIQADYEAVQVKRERDELAKMFEAVEAEASPTPPAFEPIVEEEEFMTKIALEVEEALPVEEVPAEAEMPSPQEADRHWALGVYRVEQGDLASAEEAFQQALGLAPRHAEALKAYGSLLLDQQRYAEAEEHLATLMEVDPLVVKTCLAGRPVDTSPPLLALYGSLHARQGELEAAEPLLRKALKLEPKRVEWIVAYVRLLNGLNRSLEAIEWLHNAFAQELDHAALHREYARLMAEQGQYEEVERHLKRALALEPDDPETLALRDELQAELEAYQAAYGYMALARIKAREGLIHEAEVLFEEALQIDDDHLPTLKAYAEFLEQQERSSDADRMWAMVAAEVPEEAEAILQAILDTRGENSETLNGLARICIQLGRIDEAVERLRRSLDLAPDSPETLHLLADVLEGQGRRRDAETLLGDNLVAVEADPTLSLRYAQFLAARGDYDQAKEFYQRAQELAPGDAEAVRAWEEVAERIEQFDQASQEMAVGWVAAQSGNYAEAEIYYQQALAIDPEHVPTLRYYARLLEDTNRPVEASSYLVRLTQFDPKAAEEHYRSHLLGRGDNVEVRCGYALFLQGLGRLIEAREQFQLALAMDPAYRPALNPYVDLLLQEDEVRAAETALKLALKQDDAAAEIHCRYGDLLANRYRYELAGPHLARAVELSDDPRFRESYDRIAEKLGQVRKAELAWAPAKEKAETDPDKAEFLFQDAYAACPDHVPTLLDYGEFLLQRGRHEEALRYLREAARLDPYEERVAWLLVEPEAMPLEPSGLKKEESPLGEEGSAVRIQPELEAAASEPTSPEDEDLAESL